MHTCKIGAINMCINTCVKVRNFPVCCVQILRDLPDVGADGTEFASFTVFSWSSLIHSRLLAMGADSVNFT